MSSSLEQRFKEQADGRKYCVSSTVFIAHQETQSQFLSGQCITQVQLKYFIFEIFIVNMINFRIEKNLMLFAVQTQNL